MFKHTLSLRQKKNVAFCTPEEDKERTAGYTGSTGNT